MEEEDLGWRFVCKLCNKKYPSGKSLGGHMRSHVLSNSAEFEENFEPTMKKVSSLNGGRISKKDSVVELGGPSGYGLRENPKKTWRAVDSTCPLPQEKVCKQCGKGFQSLKALCGHMACHSEKERGLKDDHSWTMDSHSETEAEDLRRQTRSKSKRYKRIFAKSSSSFNLVNGSSSVSEIEEQEQEEVAKCLMMLSRDSGNWGGVNSFVEYSDNNSVVLETKSSSIDMKFGRNEGVNCVYNGDESLEMKKLGSRKLKSSGVLDAESVQFESSYSGYFRNEAKKVESVISVDDFLRNGEYKKHNVNGGARIEVSDAELGKGFNKNKCYKNELRNGLIKEKGYSEAGIDSKSMKYHSKKKTRDGSTDVEVSKNAHKRSKHECLNCNKTFKSYQALGGHRPCHKKVNACFALRYESVENSIEGGISIDRIPNGKLGESFSTKKPKAKELSKKSKGHECPICLKVFKSGQAFGGHKRSHFNGGSEHKSNQTPVIKQEVPKIPDLIDLNLPAPVEDESDGPAQFIPY